MALKVDVIAEIDTAGALNKIQSPQFWTFAASEWHRLYTPYVPFDSGELSRNVTIRPKEIEHNAPYAGVIYNGGGMNFKRDKHALATAGWDRAAAATQAGKLTAAMQGYIDSGRLNL